ncbi:hypothetical protein EYF80_036606 [Liparis tanakae]|uniref:Uncharacterized protein n=1 Tax=Liparis tanakae TaxID=230148 RepID=A0A4Z2GI08_9TELE|nr:hypothetical protein EYF80_036606 [Liparis tanakae]
MSAVSPEALFSIFTDKVSPTAFTTFPLGVKLSSCVETQAKTATASSLEAAYWRVEEVVDRPVAGSNFMLGRYIMAYVMATEDSTVTTEKSIGYILARQLRFYDVEEKKTFRMASCCQLNLKTKDKASDLWCGGQNRLATLVSATRCLTPTEPQCLNATHQAVNQHLCKDPI